MASGLIIIVDDDPVVRKLYEDFLTAQGYSVLLAKSGDEVLKLLPNCTPKALFLDIAMPKMNGIETCKQIRRDFGDDIPIVFLTASDNIDQLRDCMRAGGDDYLIKSGDLDAVLERARFWSLAPNRQEARLRRSEVIEEIEDAFERIDQAVNLAEGKGRKMNKMNRLMATAQAHADEAQLTGQDSKHYIIGYASGIVSHWAKSDTKVKSDYMNYLRAALSGSYLLKGKDIAEVMDNFDQISHEHLFRKARQRAGDDCQWLVSKINVSKIVDSIGT